MALTFTAGTAALRTAQDLDTRRRADFQKWEKRIRDTGIPP